MEESCKIGSIPKIIFRRDRRTPLAPGRVIRIKVNEGDKWKTVRVREVWPCGYFKADWI